MAKKLTVSIIFLFFTLSYAQSQLDFPDRDVVSNDEVTELPQSDSKISNIFLPSQKTEPETQEIEPEINKLVDSKTDEAESVPLTYATFRPINRHFRHGPLLPFRHGRRCGGFRRHGMVKPWLMRFEGGEMPYGKDMIMEKDGSAAEHGGVREMPAKMERFGHGGERFEFGSEMDIVPLRGHHHRHHHHHHHHRFHVEEEEEKRENEHKHRERDEDEEEEEEEERENEHKHRERDEDEEEEEEHHHHHHHHHHDGGFFWKIRKFLHHF